MAGLVYRKPVCWSLFDLQKGVLYCRYVIHYHGYEYLRLPAMDLMILAHQDTCIVSQ